MCHPSTTGNIYYLSLPWQKQKKFTLFEVSPLPFLILFFHQRFQGRKTERKEEWLWNQLNPLLSPGPILLAMRPGRASTIPQLLTLIAGQLTIHKPEPINMWHYGLGTNYQHTVLCQWLGLNIFLKTEKEEIDKTPLAAKFLFLYARVTNHFLIKSFENCSRQKIGPLGCSLPNPWNLRIH